MEHKENGRTAVQENILGTERIGKLLAIFAIPGIISMVVNSIYNIVDQIFIGQGVGYLGNGATNVIFPLTTLVLAFAMMIGNGAGAYMSLMLGRKQEDAAARGVATGVVGLVGIGFILMAVQSIQHHILMVTQNHFHVLHTHELTQYLDSVRVSINHIAQYIKCILRT